MCPQVKLDEAQLKEQDAVQLQLKQEEQLLKEYQEKLRHKLLEQNDREKTALHEEVQERWRQLEIQVRAHCHTHSASATPTEHFTLSACQVNRPSPPCLSSVCRGAHMPCQRAAGPQAGAHQAAREGAGGVPHQHRS